MLAGYQVVAARLLFFSASVIVHQGFIAGDHRSLPTRCIQRGGAGIDQMDQPSGGPYPLSS